MAQLEMGPAAVTAKQSATATLEIFSADVTAPDSTMVLVVFTPRDTSRLPAFFEEQPQGFLA